MNSTTCTPHAYTHTHILEHSHTHCLHLTNQCSHTCIILGHNHSINQIFRLQSKQASWCFTPSQPVFRLPKIPFWHTMPLAGFETVWSGRLISKIPCNNACLLNMQSNKDSNTGKTTYMNWIPFIRSAKHVGMMLTISHDILRSLVELPACCDTVLETPTGLETHLHTAVCFNTSLWSIP